MRSEYNTTEDCGPVLLSGLVAGVLGDGFGVETGMPPKGATTNRDAA
jgi:hypothetical protein